LRRLSGRLGRTMNSVDVEPPPGRCPAHSEGDSMPVTSSRGLHEATVRDSQKTRTAHAQNRSRTASLSVECPISTSGLTGFVLGKRRKTTVLRHLGANICRPPPWARQAWEGWGSLMGRKDPPSPPATIRRLAREKMACHYCHPDFSGGRYPGSFSTRFDLI